MGLWPPSLIFCRGGGCIWSRKLHWNFWLFEREYLLYIKKRYLFDQVSLNRIDYLLSITRHLVSVPLEIQEVWDRMIPLFDVFSREDITLALMRVVGCSHAKRLTAILITLDNESTVCECIASLLGEVDEVLVVDIGSFDKTMERVRALSIPGVRLEKYRAMDCPDLNIFIRGLLSPGWAFYVGHNERLSGNRELPLKSLVNGFNGLSCPESICLCPSGWSGEETDNRIFKSEDFDRFHGNPPRKNDMLNLTIDVSFWDYRQF